MGGRQTAARCNGTAKSGVMRVIIAHHILHIEAANEAAKQIEKSCVFQSPEHGLRVHGLAMLMALFDGHDWILDCGFEAALAVEAMRLGIKHLRINEKIAAIDKLCDIAAQYGVIIHTEPYESLDLAGYSDVRAGVLAFLA